MASIGSTISDWVTGRDRNKEARAAEREEQERWDEEAERRHDYNMEVYEAEAGNYFANRDYQYETAKRNWEYGKQIQDYQYAQSLASYNKSQDLYERQSQFNALSENAAINDQMAYIQDLALSQAFQRESMQADLENTLKFEDYNVRSKIESENFGVMSEINLAGISKLEQGVKLSGIKSQRRTDSASIQQNVNELTKRNTFEKEAKLVERLQKGGKAALRQAGKSRQKGLQSTAAASFRDLVVLDASLSGSRKKAAIDLLKIQVDSSIAETQVGLNLDRLALGVTTAQERARLNIGTVQEQAEMKIDLAKDEVKYNSKILEANMRSAMAQQVRQIEQIKLQKYQADTQAFANLNLFPEELAYAPEPQMTPERKFIAPLFEYAPKVPKGERVATGFDSVVNVVGEAAGIATSVMSLGTSLGSLFPSIPNMAGNAATAATGMAQNFNTAAQMGTGILNQNYSNFSY